MRNKFFLLLLVILQVLTTSCFLLKPVTVKSISNFKTVTSGPTPEFRFDMSIYNPNKFSVVIKNIDVGIYMDTLPVSKTILLQETEITRRESSFVTVAMLAGPARLEDIFKAGISGLLSGNLQQRFQVKGEIKIKKFIFSKNYRFSEAIKF